MRLVFLGAPGSGKGTQAKFISEEYNIPIVCMGDIFRKLSKEDAYVKKFVNAGDLIPDKKVNEIAADALKKDNIMQTGFILDGFPRTIYQAKFLEDFLKKYQLKIDIALLISVEPEFLIKRISSRRICKRCGAVYNLITNPPQIEGKCDICGDELYQREDDKAEIVRRRIEKYNSEIKGIVDYYRSISILKEIDGKGSIQEVYSIIIDMLEHL